MKDLADSHVAIIGLGLMGGSLAAALKGKCAKITGCDVDAGALATALQQGWIQQGTLLAAEAVRQTDLVVLSVPVGIILRLLVELAPYLPAGCIVMDLGSTKALISERMSLLPESVHPLGGHPMCGKEVSGIQAADSRLFADQTFILTPLERTSPEVLNLGVQLVNAVGAHPLVLSPQENDQLAAYASHLPFLLSAALVDTVSQVAQQDSRLWQVTASGFRDTSRLAASNVTMMVDILTSNRREVLQALAQCRINLDRLESLLENGSDDELRDLLQTIHASRKEWRRS